MRGISLGQIDRRIKAEKNQKAINEIKNIDVSTLLDDFLLDNHAGFEKIMRLHQILKPDWVKAYNDQEKKKPKNIQTFISEEITAQDIIDEASGDEITELALATIVSNRIAHYVTNLLNNKLADYQKNNHIKMNKVEFKEVTRDLRRYFDPENKDREKMLKYTENALKEKSIKIEDFNRTEMESLISIQNSVFALKDHAIKKMLVLLKDREDINYGMRKDKQKGTQAFVMDLPYYGQFAVHLKEPKLSRQCTEDKTQDYGGIKTESHKEVIEEGMDDVRKAIIELLKGKNYEHDLYEIQNVMLTSEISEQGNEFLKSLRGLKTDEEKIAEINKLKGKDPRYHHYLMVKSGYNVRGEDNEPNI